MSAQTYFRITGLPADVTDGQVYNLLFLFPGLCGYQVERTTTSAASVAVCIAGDATNAQYFTEVYHGRAYDGSVKDPSLLAVEWLGEVVMKTPSSQSVSDSESQPNTEPQPSNSTLYGSGFTSREKRSYVEDKIERLAPGGLVDVRVVMRRNGVGMVFVDFDTFESARSAKRAWRDGIQLKTGLCTFEMSRTC